MQLYGVLKAIGRFSGVFMADLIHIRADIPTVNIEMPIGNARRFEVTVTVDGKPFDLSAAELKMMVAPSVGLAFETTGNIQVVGNVLTLDFPPDFSRDAKWRRAKYDILNVSTRHTLMRGEICLLEVVTR
jgi:protein-L-isoaspartate O-methyltransferase